MPLSEDPVKRRRQLEALAGGAERRAATLRSRIAELDGHPRSIEDEPAASIVDDSVAASDDQGAAGISDDRGAARIIPGSYPAPAKTAPAKPAPAPPASEAAGEDADVDEPEHGERQADDLEEPSRRDPGRGVTVAARLLGVRRR